MPLQLKSHQTNVKLSEFAGFFLFISAVDHQLNSNPEDKSGGEKKHTNISRIKRNDAPIERKHYANNHHQVIFVKCKSEINAKRSKCARDENNRPSNKKKTHTQSNHHTAKSVWA